MVGLADEREQSGCQLPEEGGGAFFSCNSRTEKRICRCGESGGEKVKGQDSRSSSLTAL